MKDDGFDDNMGEDANELDDGPNMFSKRRVKSPTRALATKRKKAIHAEEPDTKKSIVGDLTHDANDKDIDSNSRIELAVSRQTAKVMMSSMESVLTSADVSEIFSPERACRPGMP